jgi:hypothetical protein
MSVPQDAPRWASCCQGAEEVDGMRLAADGSCVEIANYPDGSPGWVMYIGPDEEVVWSPCRECPMCRADLRPPRGR